MQSYWSYLFILLNDHYLQVHLHLRWIHWGQSQHRHPSVAWRLAVAPPALWSSAWAGGGGGSSGSWPGLGWTAGIGPGRESWTLCPRCWRWPRRGGFAGAGWGKLLFNPSVTTRVKISQNVDIVAKVYLVHWKVKHCQTFCSVSTFTGQNEPTVFYWKKHCLVLLNVIKMTVKTSMHMCA